MNDLRLRGYVTPEDFTGTDAEKLQQALNYAAESDIRKVVLSGTYHADTVLTVPANMYVVLEGTLCADVQCEKTSSFSFEQNRIYLKGGKIQGNLDFYHARHIILEDLQIDGDVKLEFCRDLRLENMKITGKLTFGRGCANAIAQHLQLGAAVLSSRKLSQDVLGREPNVRNIALRDSQVTGGIQLVAAEDFGLLNIQVDHCSAESVTVGQPDEVLPKQQYTNFTLTDLTLKDGMILHNPCRNGHILP